MRLLAQSQNTGNRAEARANRGPWRPVHELAREPWSNLQRRAGQALFDNVFTEVAAEAASTLAVLYASCLPGVRFHAEGDLVIATGLPDWAFPRGGICIGRVFLTGRAPTPAVVRHEVRHVDQWRRYGLAMPLLYWISGADATRNWFEVQAGLADGGYSTGR